MTPFTDQTFNQIITFIQSIATGVECRQGDAHSFGHLFTSHIWLANIFLDETNLFPKLVIISRDCELWTSFGTLDFASNTDYLTFLKNQ